MSLLHVNELTLAYPGCEAIHNISLDIQANTITALVGPNGAGKTTLLCALAGLLQPVSGEIIINDIDVVQSPHLIKQNIGFLPDFFGLYQGLTVAQSIEFTEGAHKVEISNDQKNRYLNLLGLTDLLDKQISTLSRGQSQRLSLLQTILPHPKVLLLDEPASGLDPEARILLSELLHELRGLGITLVVSSHILAELADYSTHMMVIREGKIVNHMKIKDKQSLESAYLASG